MTTHDEIDPAEAARLRAAMAKLPAEVAPEQDLWPAIRSRIEAGRVQALPVRATDGERAERTVRATGSADGAGRRGAHWYEAPRRLAAAALLLVSLTATATWVMTSRSNATGSVAAVDSAGAFASFASYERSAAELAASLDRRSATLDPRTLAVLERSLRTIDGAIAEAREALASDPGNPAVQAFVAAAYRQKLDFLRRANDVAVTQGP